MYYCVGQSELGIEKIYSNQFFCTHDPSLESIVTKFKQLQHTYLQFLSNVDVYIRHHLQQFLSVFTNLQL